MAEMTPKQRLTAAFNMQIPDVVPTMEIDFQLHKELLGEELILGKNLCKLRGKEKLRALNHNIDLYIKTAYTLDYSSITVHPAPTPLYTPEDWFYETLEDELYVINNIYRQAGENIFVSAGIDATYAIPDGDSMLDFSYGLIDKKEEMLDFAKKNTRWAIEQMKKMIDAGASIMYNCSDYCFNSGPFLSPSQFEIFVYPFLKIQISELKKAGAYVIKHTDGNIMPIIDMLLDCKPHCIHSIDPLANMDLASVKEYIGSSCAIMGNVDSTLLQTGDVEGITKSAVYALTKGLINGGYIFSTCNSVFTGIALENYLLMLEVRKKLYHPHCIT